MVLSVLPPIDDDLRDTAFLRRLGEVIEGECDKLLIEAAAASEPPNYGPEAADRLALLVGMS